MVLHISHSITLFNFKPFKMQISYLLLYHILYILIFRVYDKYKICVTLLQVNYCLLETKLIPETMCVCVLYVRPKKEDNNVTDAGLLIKSEMVENFTIDIPAGAFEEETVLCLKVRIV